MKTIRALGRRTAAALALGAGLAPILASTGALALERAPELSYVGAKELAAEAGAAIPSTRPHPFQPAITVMPQMSGPSNRDQKNVGSCHAFGAIGALEAAHNRHYGGRIRFSEADVFLRRMVLEGVIYEDYRASGQSGLAEGGFVADDLRYAIANGVASSLDYAGFEKRYTEFRAGEQRWLMMNERYFSDTPWYVRLFKDPRAEWVNLQANPAQMRYVERWLAGPDPKLAGERAASKAQLAGFRVASAPFPWKLDKALLASPRKCQEAGLEQADAILAELNAGRPVAVEMNLAGLPAWGQTSVSRDAYHAFLITGYEFPNGRRVLKTRNSWGGSNPDIAMNELCRVYTVVTVLVPGETSTLERP